MHSNDTYNSGGKKVPSEDGLGEFSSSVSYFRVLLSAQTRASFVGCYLEHMLGESHLPRHPEQSRQRTKAGSVAWQNRGP